MAELVNDCVLFIFFPAVGLRLKGHTSLDSRLSLAFFLLYLHSMSFVLGYLFAFFCSLLYAFVFHAFLVYLKSTFLFSCFSHGAAEGHR